MLAFGIQWVRRRGQVPGRDVPPQAWLRTVGLEFKARSLAGMQAGGLGRSWVATEGL